MALVKGIRNKLRSRRGASIIMAMLLFMVCAVVGTVVLTAGTAAGGRASQLAEADRRYFSVTSAAELLAKELGGKTYTIERTFNDIPSVTTTTVVVDANGNPSGDPVTETSTKGFPTYAWGLSCNGVEYKDEAFETALSNPSFLLEAALTYVFGEKNPSRQTKEDTWDPRPGSKTKSWSLIVTPSEGGPAGILPVQVTAELKATGDLILTLQDGTGSEGTKTDHYRLRLTMSASVSDNYDIPAFSVDTQQETKTAAGSDGSNSIVTTVTVTDKETRTTSIGWTVSAVTPVTYAAAAEGE